MELGPLVLAQRANFSAWQGWKLVPAHEAEICTATVVAFYRNTKSPGWGKWTRNVFNIAFLYLQRKQEGKMRV
jgi:hypothetical protein